MTRTRLRQPTLTALVVAGLLGSAGCNLGFDPSLYEPIPQDSVDAGDGDANSGADAAPDAEILGCEDRDEDGFGVGRECPKDRLDCDDTRAFAYPGAPEVCDGVDNDCDGTVDLQPDGNPLRMECYTGEEDDRTHPATACRAGFMLCQGGQFPEANFDTCVGQVLPSSVGETSGRAKCDGVDNDCDGVIDPECSCPGEGVEQECYEAGAPDLGGRGQCVFGIQRCVRSANGDLNWGECVGDIAPGVETCLNPSEDNDCNGFADDIPGDGDTCVSDTPGVCRMGVMRCNEIGQLACASVAEPTQEVCNSLDDDCDGMADEGVRNSCGGCDTLGGVSGEACGQCGTWTCDSANAIRCADPGFNICGGCGTLSAFPGDTCGQCGSLVCNADGSALVCDDPGTNTCGGCGNIAGGGVGLECGVCGETTCDGPNSVTCTDPGLNACLDCGTLSPEPGTACGACGYNRCTETGTACHMRDCIPNSTTPLRSFRGFNTAVLERDCQSDADCGDWGYCTPALGDEPDTCSGGLVFSILGNSYPLPLFFNNQTPYLTSNLITFITSAQLDVFVQNRLDNRNQVRVGGVTVTYSTGTQSPQERTLLVSRRQEFCADSSTCTFGPNPTCSGAQCVYQCTNHSDCASGVCDNGACTFYNVRILNDNNIPVPNMARVRLLHSHLDFNAVNLTATNVDGQSFDVASNVVYDGVSAYLTLPPDTYTFQLTTMAGLEIPLEQNVYELRGGNVVTLLLQGRPGASPVRFKAIYDRALLPVLFDGN